MDSLGKAIQDSLDNGTLRKGTHLRIVRNGEPTHSTPPLQVTSRSTIPVAPDACSQCKGTGHLSVSAPFGNRLIKCECKKQAEMKKLQTQLLDASGILGLRRFRNAAFSNFNHGLLGVKEAWIKAQEYASAPDGWLVFVGAYGCGKTHLAVAIARQRIEACETVLVQSAPDLLDYLRETFAPGSGQSYSERFDAMKKCSLLVLDDYGAQNDSPWATEKLYQLLNNRYNAELPTIITSNGLDGCDPRIESRLCDDLVYTIEMHEARDYRKYGNSEEE
jgi:DNA replication protein DnaC